jgi:hypothetical protein
LKPDLIVIGAMKCGTSTVCAYLEDHPDVFMVPNGEPNYFSHDENFAHGPDWYARHFDGHAGQRLCGEGSNDYASGRLYPQSATRMAAYQPAVKIIYMVRHPIARMTSAWVQNRVNFGNRIPPTLDRAVTEMPDRYLGQSLYWENLSRYRAVFPDAQIFVGFMEDMEADQPAFFARLCAFLNLPLAPEIRRGHVNPSAGKKVPNRLHALLNGLPFVKRLKKLAPKGLRQTLRNRFLTDTLVEKPRFSPGVHDQITAEIGPDAAALLVHCGKPADFWKL